MASAPSSTSSSPPVRARPTRVNGGASTVLTAELVNARRRGAELFVAKLGDEGRGRALVLAGALVELFRANVGLSRDEIEAALAAVSAAPRDRRLKDGLTKLLDDRCTWSVAND